jgi:hypothetical protein
MKKGELWARWVEKKGRSEYDRICLAPGDEIASCSSSQSDFSGNDESSNYNGVNDDSMFVLMGSDSDIEEERQICEWNAREKIKNNKEKRKALLKRDY